MGGKRKRSRNKDSSQSPAKRHKSEESSRVSNNVLLSLYYPKVSTLRAYILSCFPDSSKSRKQRIKSVPTWQGHRVANGVSTRETATERLDSRTTLSENNGISMLLDTTIVGHGLESGALSSALPRKQDLESLKSSLRSSAGNGNVTQHEVCLSLSTVNILRLLCDESELAADCISSLLTSLLVIFSTLSTGTSHGRHMYSATGTKYLIMPSIE